VNSSTYSFIAWAAFMVMMIVGLGVAARRGRTRARETEDVASRALPEIGLAAERAHSQRFGTMPTMTAGGVASPARTRTISWYPPNKSKPMKHG